MPVRTFAGCAGGWHFHSLSPHCSLGDETCVPMQSSSQFYRRSKSLRHSSQIREDGLRYVFGSVAVAIHRSENG